MIHNDGCFGDFWVANERRWSTTSTDGRSMKVQRYKSQPKGAPLLILGQNSQSSRRALLTNIKAGSLPILIHTDTSCSRLTTGLTVSVENFRSLISPSSVTKSTKRWTGNMEPKTRNALSESFLFSFPSAYPHLRPAPSNDNRTNSLTLGKY